VTTTTTKLFSVQSVGIGLVGPARRASTCNEWRSAVDSHSKRGRHIHIFTFAVHVTPSDTDMLIRTQCLLSMLVYRVERRRRRRLLLGIL